MKNTIEAPVSTPEMCIRDRAYGGRFNPVVHTKERFPGGSLTDRTVAASFQRSVADIEKRRGFVLELDDVDGAVTRITQMEAAGK